MLTKKEVKLLTELLSLEGVKVAAKHQHEGIGIILAIESVDRVSICSRCGLESDKLHQNHRQIIKDLDWGGQALFLEVNRRQFKCEMKEEFREIFEKTENWGDGLLELGKWLSKAQKYFVKSQSTIYR